MPLEFTWKDHIVVRHDDRSGNYFSGEPSAPGVLEALRQSMSIYVLTNVIGVARLHSDWDKEQTLGPLRPR